MQTSENDSRYGLVPSQGCLLHEEPYDASLMARIEPALLFRIMRERYRVFLRRYHLKQSSPWTTDPILSRWRFCNVFREDDKTTIWLRNNIREPLRDSDKVLMAVIAYRWFNRIETAEKIKDLLLDRWDSREAKRRLWLTTPVVTGAYMVKTPVGMDKLNGVCWCIDQAQNDKTLLEDMKNIKSIQGATERLRKIPFMGGFAAYEVATDLRHTKFLEQASDINTWANAGPGCSRGLGWVFFSNPNRWRPASSKDQQEMLDYLRHLLRMSQDPKYWPADWPKWEMRDAESACCETSKYINGLLGNKLKRGYIPCT